MGEYDKQFVDEYQRFIDTLTKQADNYVVHHILSPNEDKDEDKDDEKEKPICTTDEFKNVCKELGLEED